ncbi:MAG: hypothetical protein LC772_08935 [Chloroflexi bacterium]|nr:hypothetical protein [Chloroflexota bacterium]
MKPLIKGVVRSGSAPIRMVDNTGHIGMLSEIFIELNEYRELSDSESVYFIRSRSERGRGVFLQFRVNTKIGRLMWARSGLSGGEAPSQVVIPRLDVLKGTPVFDMHAYGKHPWTEEADEAEENIFAGWDQDQNLCFGLGEPARWTMECRVGPDFSV